MELMEGTNFLVMKADQDWYDSNKKLPTLKKSLKYSQIETTLPRMQRIKINRLKIGHTKITHDFLT